MAQGLGWGLTDKTNSPRTIGLDYCERWIIIIITHVAALEAIFTDLQKRISPVSRGERGTIEARPPFATQVAGPGMDHGTQGNFPSYIGRDTGLEAGRAPPVLADNHTPEWSGWA